MSGDEMRHLVFAMLLALCASVTHASEALVIYFNEDGERVRAAIVKLRAAIDAERLLAARRVRVEHVVVDYEDPGQIRRVVRSAAARRPVAMIAASAPIAQIAQEEAVGIPVLFGMHQDPVDLKVAESYRRPGGNLTGLTLYRNDEEKRLELLREIAPKSVRLGVVVDEWWDRGPGYRHPSSQTLEKMAREKFGFDVRLFQVDSLDDLKHLSANPRARAIDVWYVAVTRPGFDHPAEFTRVMATFRRPAIYYLPLFTQKGGLLSYQQTFENPFATWATMLGLILDGFPPGEIPIERPKIFELAVNVKAAREQGITIPKSILLRATDFY
jgi:putative ABC transport system substrate-binding protein